MNQNNHEDGFYVISSSSDFDDPMSDETITTTEWFESLPEARSHAEPGSVIVEVIEIVG